MLIFVLQTIWLYIKELAGKDLDIIVVAKFLFYFTPKLIPLVLPLTILLASIMVFGSFAENYEFAAMKSTGISLQRSMAGLSIFIVILGITTFFFSNNVIPWAEYNSYNLRKNIAKLKPAMAIAEGQFNEVMNYNIKVANKHGDRGQFLDSVVMHKKTGNGIGNYTTIISKTGELIGNEDSDVLKFILYDGYFYDDAPAKDAKERLRHPMTKSYFKKYTINIDLSGLNQGDLEEKNISDKYNMLDISDLNYSIDSLREALNKEYTEFSTSLYNRSNLPVLNTGLKTKKKDSTFNGDVLSLFSNRKKVQLIDMAINANKSSIQIVNIKDGQFQDKHIWLNKHIIALHEKLALGFACVILFFVGAPLGALIRKGGIGLPMVVAILLFLTYHFIGIFAKNSAKDGSLNPVFAAWFSTLIMLPLGIYLTKRATADRGLFEFDHIIEPLKKLVGSRFSKKQKDKNNVITLQSEEQAKFFKFYKSYKASSTISIIFYIIALVTLILFFVFKNNKLPEFAEISIQLSIISWLVYLIYFFQERWAMSKILNLVQTELYIKGIIPTLLSVLFYPMVYYFRRNNLKAVLPES